MSPLMRYALFQVPALAVITVVLWAFWRWGGVPGWVVLLVIAGWIAKDLLLYPLVKRSYERVPQGVAAMVGKRGVARRRLAPEGTIALGAEVWRAELAPGAAPVDPGRPVRVVSARGRTLIVRDDSARE
ncbi:MAG: NfeD family protein [Candidatus Binatia bacterium]